MMESPCVFSVCISLCLPGRILRDTADASFSFLLKRPHESLCQTLGPGKESVPAQRLCLQSSRQHAEVGRRLLNPQFDNVELCLVNTEISKAENTSPGFSEG
ncbi:hypothetical protein CgunFtcFv8_017190 [Champsocephalus gunnari]|uniref:Uncharacterized protein n=1 Tax=Champsocephalus gunnari TaxID=52237 RepID=A0AAN8HQ53_CHAGU|nr:hypothetical protein CgunFtcFv8_017190 [Champsocephalus gunnari]